MNGKGDTQRPAAITHAEYSARYAGTFCADYLETRTIPLQHSDTRQPNGSQNGRNHGIVSPDCSITATASRQ